MLNHWYAIKAVHKICTHWVKFVLMWILTNVFMMTIMNQKTMVFYYLHPFGSYSLWPLASLEIFSLWQQYHMHCGRKGIHFTIALYHIAQKLIINKMTQATICLTNLFSLFHPKLRICLIFLYVNSLSKVENGWSS